MTVFLNGEYVPADRAVVSVFDRGFLYGDGLFEAMLVRKGRPFRWRQHMARLACGLTYLKIAQPFSDDALLARAMDLIKINNMPEAILRLSISRGIGARGYSPQNAAHPSIVMSLHPAPSLSPGQLPRWRVVTSTHRLLAGDPMAGFKSANKLVQVMARAEADAAGAHEAILLNTKGHLAEGTTSNLFWISGREICTPPLVSGGLPGVTRAAVMEICVNMKIRVREKSAPPAILRRCAGAFLTMTSMGVVEIESLDGKKLRRSPLTAKMCSAYLKLLNAGE